MSVIPLCDFRAPPRRFPAAAEQTQHIFKATDANGEVLRFTETEQFSAWSLGRTDVTVESNLPAA